VLTEGQLPSAVAGGYSYSSCPIPPLPFILFVSLNETDLHLDSTKSSRPLSSPYSHKHLPTERLAHDSRFSMSQEGSAPALKREDGSVLISFRALRSGGPDPTAQLRLIITPYAAFSRVTAQPKSHERGFGELARSAENERFVLIRTIPASGPPNAGIANAISASSSQNHLLASRYSVR